MIGGWRPFVPDILDQTDRVGAKSPIFDRFLLVEKHSLVFAVCSVKRKYNVKISRGQ